MALRSYTWALGDAALSSGAVLSAAGGGLPQRVAQQVPVLFGTPDSASGPLGSVGHLSARLVSDGGAVVASFASQRLVRFDTSGGTLWTATGYEFLGVEIDESLDEVYAVNYLSHEIRVYRLSTGAFLRSWPTAPIISPGGVAAIQTDQIWVAGYSSNQAVREFDRNGVATGRSVTGSLNILGEIDVDATHVYLAHAGGLGRRAISNSVEEGFGTPANASSALGEYWSGYAVGVAVTGSEVLSLHNISTLVEVYDKTTRAALRRASSPGFRPGQVKKFSQAQSKGGLDAGHSDFVVTRNASYSLVRLDRRTARATFTRLFSTAATLTYILVPGSLGNERDATYDDRKTRCYYSTNGVDFTEFTPGSPLSVALAAGTTLTVRADMNTWAKPTGTPPWIAGDAGEGPTLIYDDGNSTDGVIVGTVSTPATIVGTVSTPATIVGTVG